LFSWEEDVQGVLVVEPLDGYNESDGIVDLCVIEHRPQLFVHARIPAAFVRQRSWGYGDVHALNGFDPVAPMLWYPVVGRDIEPFLCVWVHVDDFGLWFVVCGVT
jgi:hypothetical protein